LNHITLTKKIAYKAVATLKPIMHNSGSPNKNPKTRRRLLFFDDGDDDDQQLKLVAAVLSSPHTKGTSMFEMEGTNREL